MSSVACAQASAEVGEHLIGSAPVAQCWVVLEQPGPWGRQALIDSHLDPELGARLIAASEGSGTRVILARHPARPERSARGPRRVWIAHTAPGTARLRTGEIDDPAILAEWDLAAMARGTLPEFGERAASPVFFVCANGGRDACCAIRGRELLSALSDDDDLADRVWECSHLGGHRFAPTALALPSGYCYGRLDPVSARLAFAAEDAGGIEMTHARGRSSLPSPMQVADAAVRELGIHDRDALDVLWLRGDRAIPVAPGLQLGEIASMTAEVRHLDGRAWRVRVRQQPHGSPRPESCGREAVTGFDWIATAVEPAANWS